MLSITDISSTRIKYATLLHNVTTFKKFRNVTTFRKFHNVTTLRKLQASEQIYRSEYATLLHNIKPFRKLQASERMYFRA